MLDRMPGWLLFTLLVVGLFVVFRLFPKLLFVLGSIYIYGVIALMILAVVAVVAGQFLSGK